MVKGVTRSGFEFEVDEKCVDMELLDTIAEMDENPALIGKILKLMLGNEQKKALYEHLRGEDGRVPLQGGVEAIIDIFNAFKDGKNS